MEWDFNWPSGMLREQNLIQLSKSDLFDLQKNFAVYLGVVEAKYNKKPPKPKETPAYRPRKSSKSAVPVNLNRICVDAAHDYKIIGDRVKKVLALGKNRRPTLPRYS